LPWQPFLAFCIWGAHWRHLANTNDSCMCDGDAALCQITLTTCFLLHTPSSNCAADTHALPLKWRGSAQERSFWGLGWWVTEFDNVPQKNPPKRGVSRQFQAKLPKSKNCHNSEIIHPISPKYDDETHTINGTSWVVHQSHTWHTTWLTSAILNINITS